MTVISIALKHMLLSGMDFLAIVEAVQEMETATCHAAAPVAKSKAVKTSSAADAIIDDVCAAHDVTRAQLTGKSRRHEFVRARHEAMYLLREQGDLSLPVIGDLMGGKDHSTVMYACRQHAKRLEAASH